MAERYRSEVKALDADLGAFMHWFYAQPFAARTLVLVIGDHGQALGEILDGEPYFGHHVHVAGVVTRVPFYASGPGLPADVVNAEVRVSQLDVMPTIFEFLGAELPARFAVRGMPLPRLLAERPLRSLPTEAFSIRGHEFLAFVKRAGRADARAQRKFFREMWKTGTYAPKLAIERGRWKIVRDAVLGDDVLYDLERDPHETRNLAAERPAELRAMRKALEDWTLDQVMTLKRLDRLQ
jgi:arylsulfatase A-like enzyme